MEKTRAQKLQYLHKCMIRASDIKGVEVDILLAELYRDYCIESRSELTDRELDKVIEFYLSV